MTTKVLLPILVTLAAVLLLAERPEAGPGSQPLTPGPQTPAADTKLPLELRTNDSKLILDTHEHFAGTNDPATLLRAASRSTLMTLKCLDAGGCDEEPPEDRPYFDPDKTPAKRLLEQSLRLMVEAANLGMDAAPDLSENDLLSAIRLGSEESRLLALELLVQRSGSNMQPELFEKILAEKGRFEGEVAPLFYSQLGDVAEQNPELHAPLMRALDDTWSRADASTVLELARHVEELKLDEQEYTRSLYDLCRFTARSFPKANWRALEHYLDQYRSTQGFQTSASTACRT